MTMETGEDMNEKMRIVFMSYKLIKFEQDLRELTRLTLTRFNNFLIF